MPPDSTPVGYTVRLPFQTPEEFLQRYGANLSRGGIYVRARALKPPGTPVVLEVKLTRGERVLYASAVVAYVTGTRGQGVTGMGFKFIALDGASRRFLEAAAAAMPHARSDEPPVPASVGPIDTRPEAVRVREADSAPHPVLPSETRGRLVVAGTSDEVKAPPFVPAPEPPRTGPIVGIDLGTTHSAAAVVVDGAPVMLARDGQALVPSVVALSARGQLTVGGAAKGQVVSNPRWTVFGFKRLIGRAVDSPAVRELVTRFPFEVVASEAGECAVRLADRVYRLEEIAALILMEVKRIAEHHLRREVHRAVLTVPAWFSERQRGAVREAGLLAGLHVERIVNEPTAGALAWGYSRRRPHRVLVYDLGGGTFDASVLELNDTVYEVVSTGGDTFLGGIDFDAAVATWVLQEFTRRAGVAVTDRVALQRVVDAAERAKMALSERDTASVAVPFVALKEDRPVDLDIAVSRAQLELLTRPLVDRTMEVCQEVLRVRGLRADQIDEIVLVGGQSRAPLVQQRLAVMFGRKPQLAGNPEEAVALGAALLADSLDKKSGLLLIDVVGMTIGVGLPGDRFHPVISRNTSLPATRSFRVATTRDGQTSLELVVFQGESVRASDNAYVGAFTIEPLPQRPRGEVTLELTFELSTESVLTLTAREASSGIKVSSRFATRDTPERVKERLKTLQAEADDDAVPRPGLFRIIHRLFGQRT